MDSRFRTTSMDEAELSVNSRCLMPESGSDINAIEETNELVPETSWLQENPHLVKKVDKPKSAIGKRSSAPVNKRPNPFISVVAFSRNVCEIARKRRQKLLR